MKKHKVTVVPSKEAIARNDQLAWKLAVVASETDAIEAAVKDMVINRIIDNAAVAGAALNRGPVSNARSQALAHPREDGATVFGIDSSQGFDAEWAAWANGTAVRELDMHDTFLAADYSHPADSIPAILAVAQQCGRSGTDLVRGIVAAYEVHIALVKGICLHEFKKDHVAHLGAAQVAGIGSLLKLDTEVIYQALQHIVHVAFATRQSRKGEISSWKAYAPAHTGKLAIEAIDRAMRGEQGPSPIYEGEDSVLAYMLAGKDSEYTVELPETGEARTQILESYTKEHSAEYQSQALIDLAFRMREAIDDFSAIEKIEIETSHHTHYVIGTGSGDPQKFDPKASRETLDHSIMYIFAVALQDGKWHHVTSYAPERASRKDTVELWQKISTKESAEWTKRYHASAPADKAFGASVSITLNDGKVITDELALANAHAHGAKPFARADYVKKCKTLLEGIVSPKEQDRFISACENVESLSDLKELNIVADAVELVRNVRDSRGIF